MFASVVFTHDAWTGDKCFNKGFSQRKSCHHTCYHTGHNCSFSMGSICAFMKPIRTAETA